MAGTSQGVTARQGWECPKCQVVWSPEVRSCEACRVCEEAAEEMVCTPTTEANTEEGDGLIYALRRRAPYLVKAEEVIARFSYHELAEATMMRLFEETKGTFKAFTGFDIEKDGIRIGGVGRLRQP